MSRKSKRAEHNHGDDEEAAGQEATQEATTPASLYEILGVERNATHEEIQKAYHKLALHLHPDKNPGYQTAKQKFQSLQNVILALQDPEKKKYPQQDSHRFMDIINDAVSAGELKEYDVYKKWAKKITKKPRLKPLKRTKKATKLGIQEFEMGDAMKADGVFIGQDVLVTPLTGKLRLHIQGSMDKEDFFISPLKHEDVILGPPWFDRMAASIKFFERKISFKFKEKCMYIIAQELGSTIALVNDQAFDKSIKSSIFAYMIFVKDSLMVLIKQK
ncbi:hypothetical protein L7F22_061303 [Adiantum nelumboides]|nr:hypothetical protein [Adiantum nelumboides]